MQSRGRSRGTGWRFPGDVLFWPAAAFGATSQWHKRVNSADHEKANRNFAKPNLIFCSAEFPSVSVPMPTSTIDAVVALLSSAPKHFPRLCLEPIVKELAQYNKDLAAVKKDGLLLKNVPRENQTKELCEAAIVQNPESLKFVQEQTEELCALAVLLGQYRLDDDGGTTCFSTFVNDVREPTEFLLGLALGAALNNGIIWKNGETPFSRYRGRQELKHVAFFLSGIYNPNKLEAFADDIDERWRGHPYTHYHHPTPHKSTVEWLKAGRATSTAEVWPCLLGKRSLFKHVPAELQTEEMCAYALTHDIDNLPFIANPTPFLLGAALGMSPLHALESVREQTPLLCRLAVYATRGTALRAVREPFVTRKLITEAFEIKTGCEPTFDVKGNVVNWAGMYDVDYDMFCVPDCYWTEDLVLELLDVDREECRLSLHSIPARLLTEKVCKRAVFVCGGNLSCVPEHLKTQELCNVAVEADGYALQYVPDALKTLPMCISALERSSDNEHHIPGEFLDFVERVEQVRKKRKTKQ